MLFPVYIITTIVALVYLLEQWRSGDIFVDYVYMSPTTGMYDDSGTSPPRIYKVKKFPLNQQSTAANKLHQLYLQGLRLVNLLAKKYPQLPAIYQAMEWKEGHNLGPYPAYTINKGDTISICLRQPNGQWVDINTLMYVLIHEITHIVTHSYGHAQEFWDNMKYIIEIASANNLYYPVNYKLNPVKYCGMIIGM